MTQAWIAKREIQSRSWKNHDLSLEGIAALSRHSEIKSVQRTEACIASSSFHPCNAFKIASYGTNSFTSSCNVHYLKAKWRLQLWNFKWSFGCSGDMQLVSSFFSSTTPQQRWKVGFRLNLKALKDSLQA